MMHTILISDVGRDGAATVRTLATDIAGAGSARTLARNLAWSYTEHGWDAAGRTHWFRDRHGLHRIWTVPQRDEQSLRAMHRRGPELAGAGHGAVRQRSPASQAA